ncbi:type II toxin-antitoxin system YafQ family toxin [Helicobacter didelphidarum]|uniref:Type II toxin-antitoxin system YafQ family toxin n=1 Tax=Helicobacter didelphidarum TaxID=2040648 RepID=A0A3D8IDP2_9HELI|nr:type II toxin-antitoxin system YafQ family toxin [Helicobacter didelphidarum]RDU63210.1 type II toxin-antitoxin system YafQ family toxin [Helicobacter didelphidarum]
MYQVDFSTQFKKDYKKIVKQGHKEMVDSLIEKLANGEILESKYKDHVLQGNYQGYRECHIKPDLLLIYKKNENLLLLTCMRIGSHSEVF